jgi:hypothetical protein
MTCQDCARKDEALYRLTNEVACLYAFEEEVRALIGNTNFNILMQKRDAACALLAEEKPSPPGTWDERMHRLGVQPPPSPVPAQTEAPKTCREQVCYRMGDAVGSAECGRPLPCSDHPETAR